MQANIKLLLNFLSCNQAGKPKSSIVIINFYYCFLVHELSRREMNDKSYAIIRLPDVPFISYKLPVIANPLNKNELFIMQRARGGTRGICANDELRYIYSMSDKKYTKFPDITPNLQKFHNHEPMIISQNPKLIISKNTTIYPTCVINGNNKCEIYSFGSINHHASSRKLYFGNWNVICMNWNNVRYYNIKSPGNYMLCQCLKHNQYYIFHRYKKCFIYEIDSKTQGMIKIAEYNGLLKGHCCAIILPLTKKNKKNHEIVILFCGACSSFCDSFQTLTIKFIGDDIKFTQNNNISIFMQDMNALSQVMDIEDYCWDKFTIDLVANRYMVFIGGYIYPKNTNMLFYDVMKINQNIFYFDFIGNKWVVYKPKIPWRIYDHSSCLVKNTYNLHILGGKFLDDIDDISKCLNTHFCINLSKFLPQLPITWENERQLWIGFMKNKENHECLIDYIPKVLLFYILLFLR